MLLRRNSSGVARAAGASTSRACIANTASTFQDEGHHAIDAALPPYDGGADDAVGGKTFYSRTLKDEEHCAMDAAPPPYDSGDGGIDDADRPACSRFTRSRLALALGLALELAATCWAFAQAVSAGALYGDVDCSTTGVLYRVYSTSIVVENCAEQVDAEFFYDYTDTLHETSDLGYLKQYVGCDSPTNASTDAFILKAHCTCYDEIGVGASITKCSWVALSNPSDGKCYAQKVYTNSSDGTIHDAHDPSYNGVYCWPSNPSGTVELTITALVVAVCSQLLEAFVGFKYWKDTETNTFPTLAASVFEALGVLTVSSVLLSLPGFYGVSDETSRRIPVFFWLAWTVVTVVGVGALAEITAECSDRTSRRLPYLGAVGNGLVWLGAALLEIVVATYLLWTGAGMRDYERLVRESAGLLALELLGLVSMWAARGLWTRAKLMMPSVKCLEGPLRKATISTDCDRSLPKKC